MELKSDYTFNSLIPEKITELKKQKAMTVEITFCNCDFYSYCFVDMNCQKFERSRPGTD